MNDSICREIYYNITLDPLYENYTFLQDLNSTRNHIFKVLEGADYVKICAYILTIVGAFLGNISVILTVALNRSMRSTINFYITNLAVADAMICIFSMVPHMIATLTDPIFALGEFMCKFNPFMQMTCLTCSVLTLSAISCDRFIAIMFPLHVRITKQRTSIVMQIVWVISIIVSIPFLIVKKYVVRPYQNYAEPNCMEKWPTASSYSASTGTCNFTEPLRRAYYLVISITLFFLPVAIMVTAYSLILWKLWISEVPGERHATNINVQSRARKKVIKMVFVVLVAFIICWMPMQCFILYSAYGHDPEKGSVPEWLKEFKWFAHFIAYTNSFMNPIIYGGFNKTFRDGFCTVIRCGFKRDRFRPPRSRLTFTTGVTSSPSRYTSKSLNGANMSSQKSNIEMKPVYHADDGDISPNMKHSCITIVDGKDSDSFT